MSRYLIEHGVSVASGMREALLDAFTRPPGELTFGAGTALGLTDRNGDEPWIVRAVRKRTGRNWNLMEGPAIPKRCWRQALDGDQFKTHGTLQISLEVVDPVVRMGRGNGKSWRHPASELSA